MKVVLGDGTELKGFVAHADKEIEIITDEETVKTNFLKFMSPSIMETVSFESGVYKTIYHGFNRFSHLENPKVDEIRVWMECEGTPEIEKDIPLFDEMYMPKGV